METTATYQPGDEYCTESRALRSVYLSIQNYIRDQRDEIAAASSKEFLSIIKEVDGMHHLVKKPREQVSDAAALRDLVNTPVTSIMVQNTGSVITPSQFVSSLITEYGKKQRKGTKKVQLLWKDLGLHVSPLLKIFKGSSTMFGPMLREPKPPKAYTPQKCRRSVKEEKMKPQELMKDFVSEGSELMPHRTRLDSCGGFPSDPVPNTNNNQTTGTISKTYSRKKSNEA